MLDDHLEQRLQIGEFPVGCSSTFSFTGNGVDDRKLDLLLGGVQVDEQVVDFVQDFRGARVLTVDLVDHHDRGQSQFERLGQHESRLRQRAFCGVDEQHDAIDHSQGAFDLAAEIGVTRRVDDIDLHVAVNDGGVLRHDRDALLALEVHRVQNPFTDVLVFTERSTLPQHRVHERGLAVVDVRNNGDIAKIHHDTKRKTSIRHFPLVRSVRAP